MALQLDPLLIDSRRSILPGRYVQLNLAPRRTGQCINFFQELGRATSERDKINMVFLIQAHQVGVGRQLGIKNQMFGPTSVSLFPKVDKSEDFLSFLALAYIGIGIAETVTSFILGQKGQNAGLSATAHGHVV